MGDVAHEGRGWRSEQSAEAVAGRTKPAAPAGGEFRLTEDRSQLHRADAWVRRRLRMLQLKQWKRGRTAFRELRARGLDRVPAARLAARCRRYAWASRQPAIFIALPDRHFDAMGVPRLAR